jgi:predicted phosphoribosyltransferase
MILFSDRRAAGRELAGCLFGLAGKDCVVLALPRGGVPVAFEVAAALMAPLDVFPVRKLGAPGDPELAIGAIAAGGVRVVNEAEVARLGVTCERLARIEKKELDELARCQALYRGGRPALSLAGRVAILVDDGVATGATMKAAARAARIQNPARLIAAAPIGTGKAEAALRAEVDETVFATVPEIFVAVGPFYASFPQLNDEEVRALLDASRGAI